MKRKILLLGEIHLVWEFDRQLIKENSKSNNVPMLLLLLLLVLLLLRLRIIMQQRQRAEV